jgi:hypothetical protein
LQFPQIAEGAAGNGGIASDSRVSMFSESMVIRALPQLGRYASLAPDVRGRVAMPVPFGNPAQLAFPF